MSNVTNQTSREFVTWSLQTATRDDIIFIFVCAPVCIAGFFLCMVSAYVLASQEFKEKFFAYLRLECILMAIDLAIASARSLAPVYMCRTTIKTCPPQPNLFLVAIDTYIFAYLPSPIEAAALVADILASLTCLFMIKKKRNKLEQFIFDMNPNIFILSAFAFNAVMFGYQIFTNALLFSSEFIITNRIYFDLVAFSIRDGLFLTVLLILNLFIGWQVKNNFGRRISITEARYMTI